MEEQNNNREVLKEMQRSYMNKVLYDGLKVGAFFALQALSLLLYRWGLFSTLLLIIGFVAVPVLLYRLTVQMREKTLEGYIRYMQAVSYMSWVYMASLVVAFLCFYFVSYLLFNDPVFISQVEQALELLQSMSAQGKEISAAMMEVMRGVTPIQMAGNIILNAFVNGMIYIYIVCLFIKRRAQ